MLLSFTIAVILVAFSAITVILAEMLLNTQEVLETYDLPESHDLKLISIFSHLGLIFLIIGLSSTLLRVGLLRTLSIFPSIIVLTIIVFIPLVALYGIMYGLGLEAVILSRTIYSFALFLIFLLIIIIPFSLLIAMMEAVSISLVVSVAGKLTGIFAAIFGLAFSIGIVIEQDDPLLRVIDLLAGNLSAIVIVILSVFVAVSGIYLGLFALEDKDKDVWMRSFAILFATIGGTRFVNADLTKANFSRAELKGTNFRGATLTCARFYGAKMLDRVFPGNTYLKYEQLQQWLIGKGTDKNFDGQVLCGVNLQGANLADASFIGANLSEANLRYTDLSIAKLVQTQLEGTDLTGATLTAATIEDWNINSQTKLDNVICDYIYLKQNQQERRPSDPNRNFEPGEFAKLVEEYIETVDLIFKEGIDWKAFLFSFQDLRVEYGEQNVSIQAIEKKSDGAFVIRLSVPPEVNKAEIESFAKQSYETKLQVLEAENRLLLKQNASLENIVNTLAIRPINVIGAQAVASSESQGNTFHQSGTFGIGVSKGEVKAEKIAGIIHEVQPKSMAETAAEIQQLLEQLSPTYPSTTAEQIVVAAEAIKRIENNPTLKQRIINAAKEGSLAALEKALDNPAGAFITSAIKGWLEAEVN